MSLEQDVLQAYYLKDVVPTVRGSRYQDAAWKPVVYGYALEIGTDKRPYICGRMKTSAGMDALKVWESAADQKKVRDLARFNVLLEAIIIHLRRTGVSPGDFSTLHNNSQSYEKDFTRASAKAAAAVEVIMAFHENLKRQQMIDLEILQREEIMREEAREFSDMMAAQQQQMRLLAAKQTFTNGVIELAGMRQTIRLLIETVATEKIVMILDRYLAAGRRLDDALVAVEGQLSQARLSQEKRQELKLKIATALFDLIGNFAPFPVNLIGGAIGGAIRKGVEIVRDFSDLGGSLLSTTAGALGTLAAGTPLTSAISGARDAAQTALTAAAGQAEEALNGAAGRLRDAAQGALVGEPIVIPKVNSVTQMLESAKDGAIRALKLVVASKLAAHRLDGLNDREQDLEYQRQIVLESARLDREHHNLGQERVQLVQLQARLENQVRTALDSQSGITAPGVDMEKFERYCKLYIYALAIQMRFEENRASREIFALEDNEIIFLKGLGLFGPAEAWPVNPPSGLPMYYKSSSVSSHYVFIRMMIDFVNSDFTPIKVLFASGDFSRIDSGLGQLYVKYYAEAEAMRREAARNVNWTVYTENGERARLHAAALYN